MLNLLLDGEIVVPNWVANSFPIIKFIILCLILLASIALTVVVLMQDSEGGDTTNAITGVKDTYFAQNKGLNKEAKLKKITIILSIAIAVAVVVFFVLDAIFHGNIWSV